MDDYKIHIISDYYSKSYLIESERAFVLVDTGARGNSRKIVKTIHEIGDKQLKLIYITHAHFDHYASANAVREATGAPICVHEDDAEFMSQGQTPIPLVRKWGHVMKWIYPVHQLFQPTPKTNPDIRAVDGMRLDEFGIQARVKHLPGHTPGSSIVVLDDKYAFVGDLVAAKRGVQMQDLYADNWDQIKASFRRLTDMNLVSIFPGHGEPFEATQLDEVKNK